MLTCSLPHKALPATPTISMAMWCPNCQTKSPALAVGHDELICAKCNCVVVQRPEITSRRKRESTAASSIVVTPEETQPSPSKTTPDREAHDSSGEKASNSSPTKRTSKKPKHESLPEVEFIERLPKQSAPPTRRTAKTTARKASTEKKWRSDSAHSATNTSHTNKRPRKQAATKKRQRVESPAVGKSSKYLMIQIGLLIYLIGHGLTIWAFLAGNFGAWTAGSFCSVGGVAIAFVSVVQALKQIEK